jgi:mannonate dehydratase
MASGLSAAAAASASEHGAVTRITRIKAFRVAPYGAPLCIVKVETDQPGVHGVGCATFTQRQELVAQAVELYLDPFLRGRDVQQVTDIQRAATHASYWRSGPVLNNAVSGVDQALWDIKGKLAGRPVHDLFGGKVRMAAPVYITVGGDSHEETIAQARNAMSAGFDHMKINCPSADQSEETAFGAARSSTKGQHGSDAPDAPAVRFSGRRYVNSCVELFRQARAALGGEVEFCHDVHSRLSTTEAVTLAKGLEPYSPFFLEDPLPPEENGHYANIRAQTSCPIAQGEVFVNQAEWLPLIKDRLIDYIRVHMSDIGGLTPMLRLAALCDHFGVKTALHGPSDCSPVGMMANLALDLAVPNFGIQEYNFGHGAARHNQIGQDRSSYDACCRLFPGWGAHRVEDGMMWPNDLPGLGIDIDEAVAAEYPWPEGQVGSMMMPLRHKDGSFHYQ